MGWAYLGRRVRRSRDYLRQPATRMSTCEPRATWAPPAGSWNCTLNDRVVPELTHLLMGANVTAVRPAPLIACTAAAGCSPSTSGTVAWPSETVSCTGEPDGSIVPAGEFWPTTVPGGAVEVT